MPEIELKISHQKIKLSADTGLFHWDCGKPDKPVALLRMEPKQGIQSQRLKRFFHWDHLNLDPTGSAFSLARKRCPRYSRWKCEFPTLSLKPHPIKRRWKSPWCRGLWNTLRVVGRDERYIFTGNLIEKTTCSLRVSLRRYLLKTCISFKNNYFWYVSKVSPLSFRIKTD